MTEPAVLVEVTRRDQRTGVELVESSHRGCVVVVDENGATVGALGDPDRVTFLRSAVKPFQAAASLELLGHGGADLTDEEVAVGWASHRAEPRHLTAVAALLARSATDPDDLTCPPAVGEHDPGAPAERRRFNCSGKHALFALAGTTVGERGPRLVEVDSAVQRHVLGRIEQWLGPVHAVAVDGCGAPAPAMALRSLAVGFARLAHDPAFARVVRAGFAHPGLVGGEGRAETALLAAGVIAKPGAEGVFGLAFRSASGRSLAAAIKVEDGAGRAAAAAAVGIVREAAGADVDWTSPPPLGGGVPQGSVRAAPAVVDLARSLA